MIRELRLREPFRRHLTAENLVATEAPAFPSQKSCKTSRNPHYSLAAGFSYLNYFDQNGPENMCQPIQNWHNSSQLLCNLPQFRVVR